MLGQKNATEQEGRAVEEEARQQVEEFESILMPSRRRARERRRRRGRQSRERRRGARRCSWRPRPPTRTSGVIGATSFFKMASNHLQVREKGFDRSFSFEFLT
jgi:hypothetical protein